VKRGGDAVKAERVRRPFRRGKLFVVVVAPLLSLAAAVATAQGKQEKKSEVSVGDADMYPCGASPRAETAAEKSCLRGKVRLVTKEMRRANASGGGFVEGVLYSVVKETYDERGNLTLVEISDGSNGPGPVGVLFRRGVQSFDAQGRMTGAKWYGPGADEPSSVLAYSYDGRGNRVKIDSRRTKPDAHIVEESSFDADGREVETTLNRLTPDGWKTGRSKHVTAVEGGLTVVRTYSPEGALRGRTEVLRDGRGNLLGEELYSADARGEERLRRKVTYRYDGEGFLREVVYHKAEAFLGARAVYEYDEHGNCTSLTRYNADGTFAVSVLREYEYDAAGNWVKYVGLSRPWENRAPEPYMVVRRRITYY